MNRSTGSNGNSAMPAIIASRCDFCGGASLRRSRLRASDLPWLLVLHWPVRCRRCSKRQHVFVADARRIIAAHTPEVRMQDTWKNFTTGESPALRSDKDGNSNEGKR